MPFIDDVALVTGASSGIGRETAIELAKAGAKVVLMARSKAILEELADQITAEGGVVAAFAGDVGKPEDVKAAVEFAEQTYGKLNKAFNNAGIQGPQVPLADVEVDDYLTTINTNLNSVFFCLKYEIPALLRAGGGSIVNTSSILGLVANDHAAAYTASKFGLVGLTKSAAVSYAAQNIRVNAVHPGCILTPLLEELAEVQGEGTLKKMASMHPVGRLGTMQEVAKAVLWLLSDDSSFTTGSSLLVEGGFTAV